jgi:hypothetical protein
VSLIDNRKLEYPAVFRRNIVLVFAGPKDSVFDSGNIKKRKAATRQRCKRIRKLSPDRVVV